MKHIYSEPVIEVILFNAPDVIKASGGSSVPGTDKITGAEDPVGDGDGNGDNFEW